ncbi:type VI secretion system tip protein VgrG [Pseudomonas daroniae]|uniref:Type VI secretion system tip protein VgrG n=1 Tax=Phytopseudomonas daroniae TaxID=2487519 RepID=A0A4Q9QKB6_9GAMM|nr:MULTISPECIES: type VI secretion system tip protein TssI/VgrG [Pseudomonas]TBU76583.1 type VI secretion system tip protein VgrG [Pseudomonas daroniae]TBU80872.1 type VI secretion system tip protein VgrG [Pseudomonas sp. FRB 228]TBU90110.1 type VI secretion system tip protein VgrG [Pseudomonas daroniae]
MFNPSNETHFSLTVEDFVGDLQVLSFTGTEGVSQPYRFDLELVSENPDLDLEELLHKQAFLGFDPQGSGIHGQIYRVAQGDAGKRLSRYTVSLVPQLQYLHHRTNQRIYQQMSAPQIIALVLEEHGIKGNAYSFQLGQPCPERDYCVQYDETDLHFVQRLCEEEGIHYHFQHSDGGHLLVFGDDQTVFPKLGQPTAYVQGSGMVADEPVIKGFKLRLETRTSRVTRRDYDFEKPRLQLEAAYKPSGDSTEPDLEDYDYPGRFIERARGKFLSQRALERHRADYQQAEGWGDQTRLVSGHFLELSEHPRSEWNDLWLLTEVFHEGKQPQVLEESVSSDTTNDKDDFHQGYRNRFLATPWDVFYRPALQHTKPRVLGSQTAVVTGPAGEEIHCDQYGRVKVQFYWDREGQADDKTSCWLRVSSGWAGDRYGGIAIPRIGMEVLVTFLEGDPDQPLISGCLYHKENQVPYPLPANKTRTVFKTLSSPGGGGFNELRIEDKKGAEQIFIHAQRDWDENIEHDQKIRVGNERHDTVEKNTYTELKAEEHRTTHADRKVEVRTDDHLTVAQNQHVKLGTAQLTNAGREIHLKAGEKIVIEAGMELTIKAGGSFIKLDPSGITLIGPTVRVNAGGSAGSGSGIGIKPPVLPGMADKDKAGEVPEQVLSNCVDKPQQAVCEECLLRAQSKAQVLVAR